MTKYARLFLFALSDPFSIPFPLPYSLGSLNCVDCISRLSSPVVSTRGDQWRASAGDLGEGGRRSSFTVEPTLAINHCSAQSDLFYTILHCQGLLHDLHALGFESSKSSMVANPQLKCRTLCVCLQSAHMFTYCDLSLNYSNLTMTSVSCLDPTETAVNIYRQSPKRERRHRVLTEQRFILSNMTNSLLQSAHLTLLPLP